MEVVSDGVKTRLRSTLLFLAAFRGRLTFEAQLPFMPSRSIRRGGLIHPLPDHHHDLRDVIEGPAVSIALQFR